MISILFCLFSEDVRTPVSTHYPTIHTTYSAPDPIPNDVSKNITSDGIPIGTAIASISDINNTFGFFDFCKLIFGDLGM